jgi:hypothetical protein
MGPTSSMGADVIYGGLTSSMRATSFMRDDVIYEDDIIYEAEVIYGGRRHL